MVREFLPIILCNQAWTISHILIMNLLFTLTIQVKRAHSAQFWRILNRATRVKIGGDS